MVNWYAISITTAILYLVPVKYLITTFIEYYKNRPARLHKKTAIVVLDRIGMNYEKARELAKKGAKIVIANGDPKKADLAKKELTRSTKNKNITIRYVDCKDRLSLLEFARQVSDTAGKIDILINNDGFDISDMDLDFNTQHLAKERFKNHCLNFLYENSAAKGYRIQDFHHISLHAGDQADHTEKLSINF